MLSETISKTFSNCFFSVRAISSAAQTSVPKSKLPRKKASAPWWTPACKKAEAQRTRALKQFKRCVCEAHHQAYKQAAANCKRVFNSERTKSWHSFASKFNRFTPIGDIWKLMKAGIMIFRAYPDTITRRLIYSDIFILTYLY